VFLSGVFFGLAIGNEKVNQLEKTISQLDESIQNADLQFLFFNVMNKNISCTYLSKEASRLSNEAENLGKQVSAYENSKKISESSFHELKKRYTSILIKDWLMIEKIKKTCGENYTTVLYIYSNKNCDKCREQGIILSYLKEKLDGKFLVFAIDGDMDLQIVNTIKDAYGVSTYPSLVINGQVHYGFTNLTQIKEAINETS
jgi:thiol-disulfide isomerase/thioredoxin